MVSRAMQIASLVAVVLAVAFGAFVLGRDSVHAGAVHRHAYQRGHDDGYLSGFGTGAAQGREEGRAEQVPVGPARDAFNAGYAAGANDVFAGYDGGWQLDAPYVVILERGPGLITYRIASRDLLAPHVTYVVCGDGRTLCH